MLETEPMSCACETCLHFVHHEQEAAFPAQSCDFFEIALWWGHDATLALNGLKQDGCHTRVDCRNERFNVAIWHMSEALWHRLERLVLRRLPRRS